MRKLPGGKVRNCYAGDPCFLNNSFLHSRKTYAARQAEFAQTNGFKSFPGIRQGNPLIQSQCPADFRLFPAKQSGYTCRIPSSDSSPPSLDPVTHRDRRVPVLRPAQMYHGAGISARWAAVRQRYFSPNPPILLGSKSVQVKGWVA